MKHFVEFVQDFDGTYYANVWMLKKGDSAPTLLEGLPQNVSWKKLTEAIRNATGICFPFRKDFIWQSMDRKKYAYCDATQPTPNGCVVTLAQVQRGHKPDFSAPPMY